jgi:hypothetical protein
MSTENGCRTPDLSCYPSDDYPPKNLPSCLSLMLLPPRLFAASLAGAAEVIRKTLDGDFVDSCPSCHYHHAKDKPCCDIPETPCPSPYVCHIHWTGCPGDKLHYQIQITNTAKIKRLFTLTPVPFSCTEDVIDLSVNKQVLLPDQPLKTIASFTIPKTFGGGHYQTRIKVAGAYEQYILVYLTVHPNQDCCCDIEQGEIPTHIKAHHWYHHFQCEEPCFEALPQQPTQSGPTKPLTATATTKRKPTKKADKRG